MTVTTYYGGQMCIRDRIINRGGKKNKYKNQLYHLAANKIVTYKLKK